MDSIWVLEARDSKDVKGGGRTIKAYKSEARANAMKKIKISNGCHEQMRVVEYIKK